MNGVLVLLLFWAMIFYHTISSFVFCFIPRRFRRKKNIKGSRVLITGAGSGVGRQLAIEFSKHSTCLILVDLNRQSLLQTEKLLDRQSTVFIYDCDVSDHKKVYEMAKEVKYDAGDVDILVNNAGIVSGKSLIELSEDNIIKTMEVNALAHFWMCKAFLPAMMDKNKGHIVSIASIAGKAPGPRVSDYCASKYAAVGFAESLEVEMRALKLDGIKVTVVCPSLIDTGLFEGAKITIGEPLTPEYVAKEVVAGVLENEETIYLPHYFKIFTLMGLFLPRYLRIKLLEVTDNLKSMDSFTGRRQKGESDGSKKQTKQS